MTVENQNNTNSENETTEQQPVDEAQDARVESSEAAAVESVAEPTDSETDADAAASEPEQSSARDPRIPEVITNRTLFFLAPDLPPMPEAPRWRRERDDEPQDEEERGERRGRNRRGRRSDRAVQYEEPQREEPEQIDEPQAVKGSTRLAAKRQRRRESRDLGRRRAVVTESEFQARREAVDRKMLVRAKDGRVQIGVLEDNILVEHYVARNEDVSLIGNVYVGRVQNVLPSMEAAFVDIGAARNAVLYSGEVDWAAAELGPNTARKIENALNPGDKVLVQVTKDPVGHKGARLTSQISLPGRYVVFVPGSQMNGISRKLPESERSRLKKILKEILPEGVGVIVRTAAEGATQEQLERDVDRLTKQWDDIQRRAESTGKGPKSLHAEPDMLIKIIRDVFNEDFQQLIIQGSSELNTIKSYLGQVSPDLLERVVPYVGDDIFDEYRVNDMIDKALARKVWLPSGGSLVIDRTEAMTVIDVNTGKFVGSGGNLEETVTKNNLEAAEEIIRQLRLRDIGGIIVIDFIDMVLESNRDLVHRRLVEGLSRDRTKHQIAEVTSLGLVQMTRKKIGLGLLETFSEACTVCGGRGVMVHSHPVHHGEGSKGRSRRARGGGDNQKQQQSGNNGTGTHEITDDARSALTKIAASTISSAKDADEAKDAEAKLAEAAVAAVLGKSAEEVLAPAGEQDEQESGGKRSRRSRRGGRGRNKQQNGEAGETNDASVTPEQEHPSAPVEAGEAKDAPGSGARKSRRRRVATAAATTEPATSDAGTSKPDAVAIALVKEEFASLTAKPRAKELESAQPSVTLASLDAALDTIAGDKQQAEPEAEPTAEQQPEPEAEPTAEQQPEPEAEPTAEQQPAARKPKRRRRVATGPSSDS